MDTSGPTSRLLIFPMISMMVPSWSTYSAAIVADTPKKAVAPRLAHR